ncbi:outer membrane protein assembly factor BamC [Shewanella sp. JM162201]|uniref:Outer membrane protein assembly factor BamC n=1 Tax=Shewanella jiangmenensis TaxID=2837387 RepID=A0ABS5V6U9_9GAMM|nr:outer membrane protein assembly factor BamC [Shewanella jiangmenensis]MBT1445556.1 outer membrane protein assembly factor BamC [Shewanella jiangmenensis]
MLKQITPIVLVALAAGCSSPMERRQASGSDEYVNAESQAELKIPAGLKAPNYNREYDIPPIGTKANSAMVGKELDIRPPLQVLPMAEGTRVEEGSDNIKVIVESFDNSLDLKQEIYGLLKEYLAGRNVEILREDYAQGSIETGWIETEEVLDTSLWGADKVLTLKQRYQFQVEVRPHGRTGAVIINLLEHQENYDGDDLNRQLTNEDKRRYTIDMLNSSIAYMAVKREQAIKAKRLRESLGIGVELVDGEAEKDAFFLARGDFNQVWNRLRIVLPEMGFEIADMDSSKGLYFLNYNDDSGFWSSLWGDAKLDLDKGTYKLKVTDGGNGTSELKILDKEDLPLEDEQVAAIYRALSDLMKEDRKVR